MFNLLPWGLGARNDKVTPKDREMNTRGTSDSPPVNGLLPRKNKKRRASSERSTSSNGTSQSGKSRLEFMSHVEVPRMNSAVNGTYIEHITPGRVEKGKSRIMTQPSNGLLGDTQMVDDPTFTMPAQNLLADGGSPSNRQPSQQGRKRKAEVLSPPDPAKFKEVVETQFSLEILLKHRELRLIEQEIAKCQAALEQLRRCKVIPYPGQSSDTEDMLNVSSGAGPLKAPRPGYQAAESAPPWGVKDGPYSRHYACWLLPDPTFDGGVAESQPVQTKSRSQPTKKPLDRSTRGSKADKSISKIAPRSSRGSVGSRLQALPAGYAEVKEDKGPMIVKRSTDGAMVKLVCLDCRRENFNSAQGFINHCRIAHSRGFASHDAAALACGEEVEFDVDGSLITDAKQGHTVGLVHPLVRSALSIKTNVPPLEPDSPNTKKRRYKGTHSPPKASLQSHSGYNNLEHLSNLVVIEQPLSTPLVSDQTPLITTPNAPHLSTLFARRNRGGNLDAFVREATTRIELDPSSPSEDEDAGSTVEEDTEMPDLHPITPGHSSTRPQSLALPSGLRRPRSTISPAPTSRPPSSKGINRQARTSTRLQTRGGSIRPLASSPTYAPTSLSQPRIPTPPIRTSPTPSPTDVLPAPSLTSDSASPAETSPPASSSHEASGGESDSDHNLPADEEAYLHDVEVGEDADEEEPEHTHHHQQHRISGRRTRAAVIADDEHDEDESGEGVNVPRTRSGEAKKKGSGSILRVKGEEGGRRRGGRRVSFREVEGMGRKRGKGRRR